MFSEGAMENITYYNGKIYDGDEILIPSSDRSFYFGDAVYDAGCGMNGGMHLCREHVERLFRSAGAIGITPNFTVSEMEEKIRSLAALSASKIYFIYIQLSRGSAPRRHSYPDGIKPNLYMAVTPTSLPDFGKPIKLISTPDIRYSMCNVKTVNLLPNVLAAHRAEAAGCDEAVFIKNGCATECAHSNISILKGGTLFTHPKNNEILPGIAMGRLIKAASRLGMRHTEKCISYSELMDADEIIVTSSSKFALRVSEIDGRQVGGRSITEFMLLQGVVTEEFYSGKYN